MVWVCLVCILLFALYRLCYGEQDDKRYYIYGDALGSDGCNVRIQGTADRIEQKKASCYLYLRDISVTSNFPKINHTYLPRCIVSCSETPNILPGYQISAEGKLCEFESATNPGQFDARAYYREQGYFYIVYEKSFTVVSARADRYRTVLFQLKQHLQSVIQSSLPSKQAGIVQTMLLGDKSALDLDIRQLYQQNGIGHLLAISGLHITILCMAFYQFLLILRFPRVAAVPLTLAVLWSYGELTGFSISASRAILMMCLYLFGGLVGRSYDLLSAMACSALLILVQNPFAITSCSFLLSYAAILGVGVVHPALQECFLGGEQERRSRKRRLHRMERERRSSGCFGLLRWKITSLREVLLQSLLVNLSIQITTLPVLLSFYYEVPTYGILLNLLVLPLASLLVILAAVASLAGLFLPWVATFLFGTVSLILSWYEFLCTLFLKLPMPITLLGKPSDAKLYLYLFCAVIGVWVWWKRHARTLPLIFWSIGTIFLFMPPLVPALSITFLDVGQGDGILIHTPDQTTILIDGGSSSEKKVGEYRIKPYLKYHGIGKIDYMIVSHADEDHISGQKELLQYSGLPGEIQIGQILLPEPAEQYQREEGYQNMLSLAQKAGIPVGMIHSGDRLIRSDLELRCLHPDPGFDGGSANAYSTSLQLSWRGIRFLLCGDLEKTGEDVVKNRLSGRYDVLKVSHHGSKNSTTEEFLLQVSPALSVISCGRNNRYGHPHKELLERLDQAGSRVLRTDTQGAVKLVFSMDLIP